MVNAHHRIRLFYQVSAARTRPGPCVETGTSSRQFRGAAFCPLALSVRPYWSSFVSISACESQS